MKKKIISAVIIASTLISAAGCSAAPAVIPGIGDDPLIPAEPYINNSEHSYTDEGTVEEALAVYTSDDRLCTISVMPSYFDVTLDYESGDRYSVGRAYGSEITEAYPDYVSVMEPFLFENLRGLYDGDYSPEAVEERVMVLFGSMRQEYRDEIEGLASALSDGTHGIVENGSLSYEEVIMLQMIPDAIRPTCCSALSLWGERTVTGDRITLRNLEWYLGSGNQIGNVNAVMHMNNGERSLTSISFLGILDIISAVNDDGVFAAILDVGSVQNEPFIYEGKKCYTMELRYALEEFGSAREVGEFMIGGSRDFTWCHNLIISDENDSFCAEDCVSQVEDSGRGHSVLRDADTPLIEGLTWDSIDSLCIVNSFASEGNQDSFTGSASNQVRFAKFNEWVNEIGVFSVSDVKEMITCEIPGRYDVVNIHSSGSAQLIIIDYATGDIQVAFTGTEGVVDRPDFVLVGNYRG